MKKNPDPSDGSKKIRKPKPDRPNSLVPTVDQKRAKVLAIIDDVKLGGVTIASICSEHGIGERTFRDWLIHTDLVDEYKKAKDEGGKNEREGMRDKAINGFQRILLGFYADEPETEITEFKNRRGEVMQTITRTRMKKRYIPPNATALIFALKNLDPNHWNFDNHTPQEPGVQQVFRIGDQTIAFT